MKTSLSVSMCEHYSNMRAHILVCRYVHFNAYGFSTLEICSPTTPLSRFGVLKITVSEAIKQSGCNPPDMFNYSVRLSEPC